MKPAKPLVQAPCPKGQTMPHDDASLSTANPGLTVVEQRVLDRIFQHPLSHNLSWRDVTELFKVAGGFEHAQNGNLVLKLGTKHLTFQTAHDKDVQADDVMALRHFLSRAGWTPKTMPAKPLSDASRAMMVVIDHASAKIYDLPLEDVHHAPHETQSLHHSIDRKSNDVDREETSPADHRFFDAIAKDLPGDVRVVVLSHGKGQSNEGNHLLAYLKKHHHNVHNQIARMIVADLTHTTVPQQLRLARVALLAAPDPADASAD